MPAPRERLGAADRRGKLDTTMASRSFVHRRERASLAGLHAFESLVPHRVKANTLGQGMGLDPTAVGRWRGLDLTSGEGRRRTMQHRMEGRADRSSGRAAAGGRGGTATAGGRGAAAAAGGERRCRLVWPTLVVAPPPSKSRESEVGNKEREGDDRIKENKGRENVSGGKEESQR
jgi:hypothetical protein